MFKILISIQCEECDDTHETSVLSKVIDAMAWQTDAYSLQTDAEAKGWDFFNKTRCPYCSGANGEMFRDHPEDFYGQLVNTADGTPV
jgi:hypothetical protein